MTPPSIDKIHTHDSFVLFFHKSSSLGNKFSFEMHRLASRMATCGYKGEVFGYLIHLDWPEPMRMKLRFERFAKLLQNFGKTDQIIQTNHDVSIQDFQQWSSTFNHTGVSVKMNMKCSQLVFAHDFTREIASAPNLA